MCWIDFLVSKATRFGFCSSGNHWRRTSEVAARIHGGPLGRCLTEAYSVANGKSPDDFFSGINMGTSNTVWK